MPQPNDFSRSLVTLEQDSTLIAVIEMGQSSWLVAGIVPGIERQSLKKLTADQMDCCSFCIVGGRKPRRLDTRSSGSPSPMRSAAAMASFWRAGYALARLKRT